nr:tRNA (guanine(37)-N1)-methyltransferase 1 [Ipomoea batatas]
MLADVFRGLFRENHKYKDSTLPRIHVYGFSKAQDPEFDFHERIRIALSEVAFEVEMRSVRAVAPGKWMLCASFVLPERVAFGRAV